MNLDLLLPKLLGLAWLLPLASFALIVLWGRRMGRGGEVRRLSGHAGDPLLGGPVFHRAGRLARAASLRRAAA